jgi:HK97 family phage prohead protease
VQHLTLKATATETDQELGTFTALVSAWSADREKDTIDRRAFDQSIEDWRASGKRLPLLLEHSTTIVGALDPATMRPEERGLVVSGSVDRESDEGQRVWRAIKSNVASFSIGFMATKSRPRRGGGRHLQVIDLLEVSVVSKPAHAATRTLGWKSADNDPVFEAFKDAERKAQDAYDRQRVAELAAELEAKAAREAKRNRPIRIKRFEV